MLDVWKGPEYASPEKHGTCKNLSMPLCET